MIVQVQNGSNPSLYLIAQNADEEKVLQDLVDVLDNRPILTRNSHVVTGKGANNVLLTASKEDRSRKS